MTHRIKSLLFPLLLFVVYSLLLSKVFLGSSDISDIGTTVGLQLLLIIRILGKIVLQTYSPSFLRTIMIWTGAVGAVLSIVAWLIYGLQATVFVCCTHIVLIGIVWSQYYTTKSLKLYYPWSVANAGLSLITILLSLTYVATLWTVDYRINFQCSDLHDQTIGLVTRHIPSFSDNPGFQQILNRVDQFSSQTFGQLLGTDQTVLGDISLLYTGDSIVSGFMMTDLSLSQTGVSQTSGGLLSSILSYQNKFIYGLLNNQELIDAKVCDLTIEHIKNLISQKDVQLIGFIMLTLLLSVFMRSVMFAIGIVNYIILRILFFIGRFSKKKYPEECDHVEL